MEIIERNNTRIIVAILISLLIHAWLLSIDHGKTSAPVAASIRKRVTMRLVARKAPEKKTVLPVQKIIKDTEEVFHLPMPKPVVVSVKEIPPVMMPVAPAVPDLKAAPEPEIGEIGSESSVSKIETTDSPEIILATPLYRQNPPPQYPARARKRHYQGTVVLQVLVAVDGSVESLEIHQSSGHESLDRAAVKAVNNWMFEPGKKNGNSIAMQVLVPVKFQIR